MAAPEKTLVSALEPLKKQASLELFVNGVTHYIGDNICSVVDRLYISKLLADLNEDKNYNNIKSSLSQENQNKLDQYIAKLKEYIRRDAYHLHSYLYKVLKNEIFKYAPTKQDFILRYWNDEGFRERVTDTVLLHNIMAAKYPGSANKLLYLPVSNDMSRGNTILAKVFFYFSYWVQRISAIAGKQCFDWGYNRLSKQYINSMETTISGLNNYKINNPTIQDLKEKANTASGGKFKINNDSDVYAARDWVFFSSSNKDWSEERSCIIQGCEYVFSTDVCPDTLEKGKIYLSKDAERNITCSLIATDGRVVRGEVIPRTKDADINNITEATKRTILDSLETQQLIGDIEHRGSIQFRIPIKPTIDNTEKAFKVLLDLWRDPAVNNIKLPALAKIIDMYAVDDAQASDFSRPEDGPKLDQRGKELCFYVAWNSSNKQPILTAEEYKAFILCVVKKLIAAKVEGVGYYPSLSADSKFDQPEEFPIICTYLEYNTDGTIFKYQKDFDDAGDPNVLCAVIFNADDLEDEEKNEILKNQQEYLQANFPLVMNNFVTKINQYIAVQGSINRELTEDENKIILKIKKRLNFLQDALPNLNMNLDGVFKRLASVEDGKNLEKLYNACRHLYTECEQYKKMLAKVGSSNSLRPTI